MAQVSTCVKDPAAEVELTTMSEPVRHHYVPRFYLRGFTNPESDGLLHVWAKRQDGYRVATIKDAGVERHFYTVKTKLRERDPSLIENALAKIDDRAAVLLRKLLRCEPLTGDERAFFGYFVGNMFLRGPAFRRMTKYQVQNALLAVFKVMATNRQAFETTWDWYERQEGEKLTPGERDELYEVICGGDIEIIPGPEESLRLLPLAHEIGQCVSRMEWQILVAPDPGFFLTSDNPVVHVDPKAAGDNALDVGFGTAGVEATFPLSRKLLLRARYGENSLEYIRIASGEVHDLNKRTIQFASRFVYATFKSHRVERWVRESSHLAPGYKMRIGVDRSGREATLIMQRTLQPDD
jgi:hypothetical protein